MSNDPHRLRIQVPAEEWAGRMFRCTETGETFTIPVDVRPKRFYSVGEGYIDTGDGYYCRMCGVEEIT